MSKTTEKKRNNYNTDVIERVAKKVGVTTRFVRQAINGERQSETAETIKKEYKRIAKEVETFLENQ